MHTEPSTMLHTAAAITRESGSKSRAKRVDGL